MHPLNKLKKKGEGRVVDNPVRGAALGVFLVVTIFLMLFPFINTLNQFLVSVLEPLIFFKPVQDVIIPYEVRLVRVLLDLFGVPMTPGSPGVFSITLITKGGVEEPVVVGWNCLGWQSLVLVGATFLTGLSGRFTSLSKWEALLLGLLGTFLLNIGRLTTIFFLFYHFRGSVAMAFHDYGSVLLTLTWLGFFWWFVYSFVLEAKAQISADQGINAGLRR